MRKILCIFLALIPLIGVEAETKPMNDDIYTPAYTPPIGNHDYPTSKEVYDDCKNAIAIADAGDHRGFLRSNCATRIQGILSGISAVRSNSIVPISGNEQGLINALEKQKNAKICVPDKPYAGDEPLLELRIARDYISNVDKMGINREVLFKNSGYYHIVEQTLKNCGAADLMQRNGYDVSAVCNYTDKFMNGLEKYVTKEEWDAIKSGKYTKVLPHSGDNKPIYIYASDGVEIAYMNGDAPIVWKLKLSGKRLPTEMQSKEYYSSLFKLPAARTLADMWTLGCDMSELKLWFKDNKVEVLEISNS